MTPAFADGALPVLTFAGVGVARVAAAFGFVTAFVGGGLLVLRYARRDDGGHENPP